MAIQRAQPPNAIPHKPRRPYSQFMNYEDPLGIPENKAGSFLERNMAL